MQERKKRNLVQIFCRFYFSCYLWLSWHFRVLCRLWDLYFFLSSLFVSMRSLFLWDLCFYEIFVSSWDLCFFLRSLVFALLLLFSHFSCHSRTSLVIPAKAGIQLYKFFLPFFHEAIKYEKLDEKLKRIPYKKIIIKINIK